MTWTRLLTAGRTEMLQRQVDESAPFTLFGDQAGDYTGAALNPGTYTLQVQAFEGPNGSGLSIADKTIRFTVVD